jgi:uncharacterized protein
MGFTTTIDLGPVAHGLSLSLSSVEAVVRLLDADNTVPFVTRYRKDQTGGLDEEQIRQIQERVGRMRMLAERKQTILRSIDSQGKLTPELAKAIHDADSTKRLEDLYLPYKPKKQTLATLARERQLEPLAAEILNGSPEALDLDVRAQDFVNPDKQVHTAADALLGVGHILAEDFSERADLRERLRKILKKTGKLISTRIETEEKEKKSSEPRSQTASVPADTAVIEQTPAIDSSSGPAAGEPNSSSEVAPVAASSEAAVPQTTPLADGMLGAASPADELTSATSAPDERPATSEMFEAQAAAGHVVAPSEAVAEQEPANALSTERMIEESPQAAQSSHVEARDEVIQPEPMATLTTEAAGATTASSEPASVVVEGAAAPDQAPMAAPEQPPQGGVPHSPPAGSRLPNISRKEAARREREAKKAKLQERLSHEFRDYFNYQEQLSRIPPHRVLAINRGERVKILRVKIDADTAEMTRVAEELLVPNDHPHAEFLRGCARDALQRLVIPSLEREVRRELTENAETHAIEVFAKNLRNLLLQPPVHGRRVLALDPGFKSGCKLAVLDEFGNLLDQAVVHLVGKAEKKQEARAKLVELIRNHAVKVLAIGNGTACRETEEFVADLLGTDLKDDGVAYVIVNEAGASVYSTSPLGREELPNYDATLRGAISIGRRLQDPLSELVKIDPANIGVGLYQHDIKAKHLRASLDAVVESCVNYVGVDLNMASPALLRYVSGLNQLTARRLYDYRTTSGPFKNREQLKEVPGFGEATFVQAAGFLKIADGDRALDRTWIHPESYATAEKVLERIGRSEADLNSKEKVSELADQVKALDVKPLAEELNVGQMTLTDIVSQFARPGRDPREDLPAPIFKRGVLKIDDLEAGMELSGSVLNVVDFGAFVDIGLHDSGLVHVSQLANRFVRDPHEVVSVGDIVKVWVLEIDKTRRRVSLTMIPPGTKKPEPHFRRGKSERRTDAPAQQAAPGDRPPRGQRQPGGGARGNTPREGASQRPQQPRQNAGAGPGPAADRSGRRGPPQHARPYGGRDRGARGGQSRGSGEHQQRPKHPPKPLTPITKKMIEGKEPMRTFGDLLQFMKVKQTDEPAGEPAAKPPQESPTTPHEPARSESAEQTHPAPSEQTNRQTPTSPVTESADTLPESAANGEQGSTAALEAEPSRPAAS